MTMPSDRIEHWPEVMAASERVESHATMRSDDTMGIWIPVLPAGMNGPDGLLRSHHHQRRKQAGAWMARIEVALLAGQCFPYGVAPIFEAARVLFVRHYCGHGMDADNAAASFKFIGDALVKCGVLADDSPEVVRSFTVMQRRVPRKTQQGVLIVICNAAGEAGEAAA